MVDETEPGSGDPDWQLVAALGRGEESALDELMTRYGEPIFHFVYRHVLNEEDAKEIVQEVFVRLFFNAARFKPEAKFSTWLYQIALNLCRDHAKKRHTRQSLRTDSLSASSMLDDQPARELAIDQRTPSDEALARERLAALDAGMAALPYELRTALVLTVLEQRSHQECAELLKTTPKAIETRVYRARKQLWEWLARAGLAALIGSFLQ